MDTILFKVVRQNTSGELFPVNVEVHCEMGAARIKSIHVQLVRMDVCQDWKQVFLHGYR